MTLRTVLALMLSIIGATPSLAQLTTTIDAGAASVSYFEAYRMTAMSLTPTVRYERARASVLAMGTLSRFETGSFSTSGAVAASLSSSATARLRGELAPSLGGSAHEDGTRSAQVLVRARAYLLGAAGGLWIGGGGGQAWRGSAGTAVRAAEIGAWWQRGSLLLAGAVEPTTVGDTSYSDAAMSATWTRGPLELSGSGGFRVGDVDGRASWGSLSGLWWLGSHLALSAAGGSYPTDFAQAIPGGTFVSIGVRIATRPVLSHLPRANRSSLPAELARPVAGRVEIRSDARGGGTLLLEARAAGSVELMGDFTDWKVVRLERTRDGRWRLPSTIPAGTHRFNVRIDGGAWGVPRGVTTITDDFDGVVGILTVR